MTNDEAKSVLFDMLGKGIYVKDTKENQAILVALRALEREPLEDWKFYYNHGYAQAKRDLRCKWIPVSERLPDTDDEVLCWYEYYHWSREKVLPEYGIGGYSRETSAWFGEVATGRDVRVIAWMPLPEPYRAESEDKE